MFVLLVATVIKLIVYFLCFDSVIYLRTFHLFELFSTNHTKGSKGQTSWVEPLERPRPQIPNIKMRWVLSQEIGFDRHTREYNFWSSSEFEGGSHVTQIDAVSLLLHLNFSLKLMITWLQTVRNFAFDPPSNCSHWTKNWTPAYCNLDSFRIYFMNSFLYRFHNLYCMLTYKLNFHSF